MRLAYTRPRLRVWRIGSAKGTWRAQRSVKPPRKLWGFDSLPAHQYSKAVTQRLTSGRVGDDLTAKLTAKLVNASAKLGSPYVTWQRTGRTVRQWVENPHCRERSREPLLLMSDAHQTHMAWHLASRRRA